MKNIAHKNFKGSIFCMYKVCEVILFWEQKTFMNKNQVKIPFKKKKLRERKNPYIIFHVIDNFLVENSTWKVLNNFFCDDDLLMQKYIFPPIVADENSSFYVWKSYQCISKNNHKWSLQYIKISIWQPPLIHESVKFQVFFTRR